MYRLCTMSRVAAGSAGSGPPSAACSPVPSWPILFPIRLRGRQTICIGRRGILRLPAKGSLNPLLLVSLRCVVGVYFRRLEIAVPHPLLKCAHWHARSRHAGSERVSQVVKAQPTDFRLLQRGIEAPAHL